MYIIYSSCVTVDYVYKIRIASWPAVHLCEGSLQVARLSAILYIYIYIYIFFFRKDLLAIVSH